MLAAGASSRLPGPKQLLRHRGVTLLRLAAQTAVAAACGPVVVVLPPGSGPLRFELVDLSVRIVENPDAAKGLSTSVRAGLEALDRAGLDAQDRASIDAVLFLTCDQPMLTPDVLTRVAAVYTSTRPPAVACEYGGTVGVPALFDRSLFGELRALEGDQGAKRVLQHHLAETVRVPFEAGAFDVDTPEDARKLR